MGLIIDADTHVAESEHMWALLEQELHTRRPIMMQVPDDTVYGSSNAFWLIDGNIVPKPAGRGGNRLITPSASKQQSSRMDLPIESREMSAPGLRVKDMDRLHVDVQVVFPTLFLVYLTDDVELEIALCKAYNRFMSAACSSDGKRLKWVAVLPLRSIDESLKQMKWAKDHGAVGLFFRGLEKDLNLDDPYFSPVYQAAMDQDLAICIHTGAGSPVMSSLFNVDRHSVFCHGRLLPLIAFRNLVANRIPELFHKYRFYVACEADEDVAYLSHYIGEDNLIIGSDYGHNDPSEEGDLVGTIKAREDIPLQLAEKILSDNPKQFYNL